ncbi:MAG: cytochrome c nitrite reductase small subunit [Fimbriimonadaceae bacterium]
MDLKQLASLPGLSPRMKVACMASVGAFLGMGIYVAQISHATSYLSDDPEACINCHIMTPTYASWKHSSHANVATCNDCHVPHDSVLQKYLFKAMDGARHSTIFTLRREPQVLRARPEAKHVIQANCMRCHESNLDRVASHKTFERSCVDCHREVPHGRVNSLSATPNAAVPLQSPVIPSSLLQPNPTKESQ